MIVITTINPYGNFDAQKEAISSWQKKYEVYSVNTEKEIEIAKELYPNVKFFTTTKTYKYKEKNLIKLIALLDCAKSIDSDYFALVNSDIILSHKTKNIFVEKYICDGLLISTRWELDKEKNETYPFNNGYDLFVFHRKFIDLFYNSKYVIGMPWWDFYLPMIAIKSGMKVYHIKNQVIFHRTHQTNYDNESWMEFAEYFYQDLMMSIMKNSLDISVWDFCSGSKKFIEKNQINIKL